MLITNTQFLKMISTKKILVACDISPTVKSSLIETFVPTMLALCDNCKIKFKPRMLTFDQEVCMVNYNYVGKNTTRIGVSSTDIKQLMDWVECFVQPIDVVIYITNGCVVWPETNPISSKTKQYVQLTDFSFDSNLPSYIERI